MKGMFSMDSPLMEVLTKVADLIIINILFLFVSIPVFTIGAGYSAMYSVVLKLVKNEEGKITKQFFKAFKENFKQATIIWLVLLLIALGLLYDFYMLMNGSLPESFKLALIVLAFVWGVLFINIFPLIAKFENTSMHLIKNSFVIGFTHLIKTVFMALFIAAPFYITYKRIEVFPVFAMMGLSVPAFVNSIWFNKIYDTMIDNYAKKSQEGERSSEESDD